MPRTKKPGQTANLARAKEQHSTTQLSLDVNRLRWSGDALFGEGVEVHVGRRFDCAVITIRRWPGAGTHVALDANQLRQHVENLREALRIIGGDN